MIKSMKKNNTFAYNIDIEYTIIGISIVNINKKILDNTARYFFVPIRSEFSYPAIHGKLCQFLHNIL